MTTRGEDDLCIPPGAHGKRIEADSSRFAAGHTRAPRTWLEADLDRWKATIGALSGHVTGTGRPILMGDPHRELEVPAIYVQAHIGLQSVRPRWAFAYLVFPAFRMWRTTARSPGA